MIRIASVTPGSPADKAGIETGDSLRSVNGQAPRDVLDYYNLADDAVINCVYQAQGDHSIREITIQKEFGEPLGLQFGEAVFDGVQNCVNRCRFCFVDQMPKGLRETLYVKDDDYRLSMLWGNFITLTNIKPEDLDRIIDQRISPLHVSLHATDPDVYLNLVRPATKARDPLQVLEVLLAAELEVHVQIVLCSGVNDGDVLLRSLSEFTEGRFAAVSSVGIVPAGVTRYSPGKNEIRAFKASEVHDVIDLVKRFADHRKVFLADEFYLLGNEELPQVEEYEDYPQLENGIGIARLFIDEFRAELRSLASMDPVVPVVLVTGELSAPIIRKLAEEFTVRTGATIEVVVVHNQFFGGNVSVTPLLTGQDIAAALAEASGRVLLPDNIFNNDGLTLDGYRIENITDRSTIELLKAPCDGAQFLGFLVRCTAA